MIRCTDVRKIYPQGDNPITALAGVSLEIARLVRCHNGAERFRQSTLLHLIGGLDRPTSGELLVDDRLIGQMADDQVTLFRRNRIGFIFQFFNLLPTFTAFENVALPFVLDGRAKGDADDRACRCSTKSDCASATASARSAIRWRDPARRDRPRVAFNPPILLADEPTGNLDSKNGRAILDLLRQVNRQDGCTIVMVTHSDELAVTPTEKFICVTAEWRNRN